MNKKGFTLVELLAVLVILGILVTIAVPAATSVGDKAKTKMLKTKTKLAMQGAILYLQDNKSEFINVTVTPLTEEYKNVFSHDGIWFLFLSGDNLIDTTK